MLTRRDIEPDRLPNDREENKMMTKDVVSISNLNTGQELKFIKFYTHPHPTIFSFLKSTSIKNMWNLKTLDFNKDRC